MNRLGLIGLLMVAGLAACGSDARPSEDEIALALVSVDNPLGIGLKTQDGEIIDCLAEVLRDSDLSDEALRAMIEGNRHFVGSEDDSAAVVDLKPKWDAC